MLTSRFNSVALGAVIALAAALSACGGRMSSPPLRSDAVIPQSVPRTIETSSVDLRDLIYVANAGNDGGVLHTTGSITAYRRDANGNAAPVLKIAGPNTKLENVSGIALSADGHIFVLDFDLGVLVFAPGANGDVAPLTNIACGNNSFNAIAINALGTIAVASGVEDFPGFISFFDVKDTGCVAPDRLIEPSASLMGTSPGKTQLGNPHGVALDARSESYAINTGSDFGIPSITVYTPTATGDVAPVREIDGSRTKVGGGSGRQNIAVRLRCRRQRCPVSHDKWSQNRIANS